MATALELRRILPSAEIALHEKEADVGTHQSTHNSGVLHAGLYYKPGSLKARLAVGGIRRMVSFCRDNGIAHDICGKIVVATEEAELVRLKTLFDRGNRNGLRDMRWLSGEELRCIEPHAAGLAAVHVPEEGIVDYRQVCDAMRRHLGANAVKVITSSRLLAAHRDGNGWRLETGSGEYSCDFLVNCAGLHCDRVAQLAGEARSTRIVPFRGEYYRLKPSAANLVRNLIYPVPDPVFPFLGVHFTRLIGGGVEAGPNAVIAFAREGYTYWQINPADLVDAISFKGLWNFMKQHRAMAWQEVRRSLSRKQFCASLQKLVPSLQESDLESGGSGVRAQAMQPDGTLVQDFAFIERANALHVINAPSPAATASLAIGEHIAEKIRAMQNS